MTSQNDVKTHSIAQSTKKKHEQNDAKRVSRSTKKPKEATPIPIPIRIIITITIKPKEKKPNTYYNPQLYIPKGVFQSHFEHSEVKFKKSIPNQR